MTKIHIRNLRVRTLIGVGDKERQSNQDVVVNLEIGYDAGRAIRSDSIKDAVDYQTLTDDIIQRAAQTRFYLIEKLANFILDVVMENPLVQEAKILIDKPLALKSAESVAVELFRKR